MDKKEGTRKVFRNPQRRKRIFLYYSLGIHWCQEGDREHFWAIHTWNHLTVIASSNIQVRFTEVAKNVPEWKKTKSWYGWVVSMKVGRAIEMLNLLYCLFTSYILIHVSQIWVLFSLAFLPMEILSIFRDLPIFYMLRLSIDSSTPGLILELQTDIELLIDVSTWKSHSPIKLGNLIHPKWNCWLFPTQIISIPLTSSPILPSYPSL